MNSIVLKSIYDYKDASGDDKVLTFDIEEWFVLIKEPDDSNWFYVVNSQGQIGYVPNSYVTFDQVRLVPYEHESS